MSILEYWKEVSTPTQPPVLDNTFRRETREHPVQRKWTKEEEALLMKRANDGESYTELAAFFNVERGSIAGKMFRLRGGASKPKRKYQPMRDMPSALVAPEPEPEEEIEDLPELFQSPPVLDERCTIMTIRFAQCHWPIGDPHENDFYFCGADTGGVKSYCGAHHAIAYPPRTKT